MSKSGSEKQKRIMADVAIVAIVVGVVALAIYLLTNRNEKHISEAYNDAELSSLTCTTTETSDAAFFENTAPSAKHVLKMVYSDGKIDKMFYEFRGEYESWEAADHDEGILHAKYNTYMGDHEIESRVLAPVFQNVEGNLKISLYLDSYKRMNSVLGKLFYIGAGSVDTIAKNSVEKTQKYYEDKGFSCIIGD